MSIKYLIYSRRISGLTPYNVYRFRVIEEACRAERDAWLENKAA
jgi:hypothetical protein